MEKRRGERARDGQPVAIVVVAILLPIVPQPSPGRHGCYGHITPTAG